MIGLIEVNEDMYYAIVNGDAGNKLYLTGIEKGKCAVWDTDGLGQMVCKVKRITRKDTGNEKGIQVVGHYKPDARDARKFRTVEAAQKMIDENPVLRFCRVEEVRG